MLAVLFEKIVCFFCGVVGWIFLKLRLSHLSCLFLISIFFLFLIPLFLSDFLGVVLFADFAVLLSVWCF